jgi:hypothetical protein
VRHRLLGHDAVCGSVGQIDLQSLPRQENLPNFSF